MTFINKDEILHQIFHFIFCIVNSASCPLCLPSGSLVEGRPSWDCWLYCTFGKHLEKPQLHFSFWKSVCCIFQPLSTFINFFLCLLKTYLFNSIHSEKILGIPEPLVFIIHQAWKDLWVYYIPLAILDNQTQSECFLEIFYTLRVMLFNYFIFIVNKFKHVGFSFDHFAGAFKRIWLCNP